ncbi:hypothetical protein XO10_01100 [Marinitoga sp. 1135]|uniref:Uncharacterized protein n=1 Tax=Marinitoga piezophila (strain DSM 14283 / JCM 11233 / KA3) TaxID=443254 RepID=H2J399_MARPK|nr:MULTISPECIES: hypothetical protein [Marinitoga]AEX84617.1 hypothetical protein Marpi_0161 [Marinitoga piezophila KA3]NUU94906.1 hypothetical protein [Marinitoga sp. 1135]NUU96844.1 hypothetical protein [Marinitoga sp. 1138]
MDLDFISFETFGIFIKDGFYPLLDGYGSSGMLELIKFDPSDEYPEVYYSEAKKEEYPFLDFNVEPYEVTTPPKILDDGTEAITMYKVYKTNNERVYVRELYRRIKRLKNGEVKIIEQYYDEGDVIVLENEEKKVFVMHKGSFGIDLNLDDDDNVVEVSDVYQYPDKEKRWGDEKD